MGALIGVERAACWPLETLIVLAVGSLRLDVDLPGALAGARGGLVISAPPASPRWASPSRRFVPTAEGSSAIVNAIYVPMLLLSGAFFPVDELPAFLEWLAEALPLTHLLDAHARASSPTAASRATTPPGLARAARLGRRGGVLVAARTLPLDAPDRLMARIATMMRPRPRSGSLGRERRPRGSRRRGARRARQASSPTR